MRYTIAGIVLLLISCGQKSASTQQKAVRVVDVPPATPIDVAVSKADYGLTELNNYLRQFERPTQQFTTRSDSSSVVQGPKGTRIFVVPDDLECVDGSRPGTPITVSLIELQNQEDLVRNRMPTMSNGRLLESGGAYYINLVSAGKQLRLKQGRKLAVVFPKKSNKDMRLFYGVKDDQGNVNWDPAKETFRPTANPDSVLVRVPIIKYKDTILADMEVRPDHKPNNIDLDKYRQFGRVGIKMIDGHYYYVGRMEDTTNRQFSVKKVSASVKMMSDVYEVMNLNKLGWVNCDRFTTNERIAVQLVVPNGSIHKDIETLIVLRNINGVIKNSLHFTDSSIQTWSGLPLNMRAKVLSFAWKNGKAYGQAQMLTISRDTRINLDLKPVSKKDIAEMMSM